MKVHIKYLVRYEQDVEMTPEEYLNARANFEKSGLFPAGSEYQTMGIDDIAYRELEHYYSTKKA